MKGPDTRPSGMNDFGIRVKNDWMAITQIGSEDPIAPYTSTRSLRGWLPIA